MDSVLKHKSSEGKVNVDGDSIQEEDNVTFVTLLLNRIIEDLFYFALRSLISLQA